MTIRPLAPGDPQQIGRYRILGILGAGGMGRVLLGAGPDGRLVAVKQVHAHLLDEIEYRARFRREVAASTRVSGAFTAPVIDFDVDSATPWLASVFVVGIPLDTAVERYGPLPPAAVRMLAAGLASALQAIHQAALIHRDLKPANVLLATDGPRVIDFGIAQAAENPAGLTETGSVLGSPAYMSPEQALSGPLSPASDIFSLGSLLVMAATGQSPFASQTLAYTLFNIVHVEPDLTRVPPELQDLIAPCLRKDAAARPTPAQMLDYLGHPTEHGRPWPEPVHNDIDRLGTELAALAANPEATTVLPGARRGLRSGDRAAGVEARPARTGRRLLPVLLAVLLVLAVTAGAAWTRWGNSEHSQAAPLPLSLTEMREADSCAWLRTALGTSLPAEVAAGWPTNVPEWSFRPNSAWGCLAMASKDHAFDFNPAAYLFGFAPKGPVIDGRPVVGRDNTTSCDRALQPDEAHPTWGVTVSAWNEDECGLAEYVLTRLAQVSAVPRMADADRSLARLDPCALVDRDALTSLIGTLPVAPKEASAHSCVWEGSAEVAVNLRQTTPPDTPDPQIDLGNGRVLLAPKSNVAAICTREYPYRDAGNQQEQVEVKVHGNDDNDAHCAAAESIARSVVDKLPK
ncbi:serine/threonine protein kinase [Nocardia sp. NBC_01503]|uniref:serine/threonine-protein kinase n=1 Tax=Nocardia sp. NBC_01503 TaxID=2975997 RepID=UPI002E7AB22F|nr:serine/threonine-protein kinase [Nocardia sp. NBC_01503]WTL33906.1 serine/threonine protein kinase [Nocardia sp. NBC_01503]